MKMSELINKFKDSKKIRTVAVFAIVFIAVIIYFIPQDGNKKESEIIDNNTQTKLTKEEQLENVLGNIKGCGRVSVMITYESNGETVYANTTETETNTVTEKSDSGGTKQSETKKESKKPITVGSGNGESALILSGIEPDIKGVIVVAQGADNIGVKMNLQRAVETVLQVSPEQVEIFAMN